VLSCRGVLFLQGSCLCDDIVSFVRGVNVVEAWGTMCITLVEIPPVSVVSHSVGVFCFLSARMGSRGGAMAECVTLVRGGL